MPASPSGPQPCCAGQVEVAEVGAGRVALHRLPAEQEPPQPFSLPQIPELPRSLPHVEIQNLHIDALALGQSILGEAATFTLTAMAGPGPTGRVPVSTSRCEGLTNPQRGSTCRSVSIWRRKACAWTPVAGDGRPSRGRDRPSRSRGAAPLADGRRPAADWQGRLEVNAERLAQLQLAIDLAYAEQRRLAVDGSLGLAQGALPPDIRRPRRQPRRTGGEGCGDRAPALCASAASRRCGRRLPFRTAAELDLAADKVARGSPLAAPDLQRFSTVAATPLAGSASLHLTAAGAASRPN